MDTVSFLMCTVVLGANLVSAAKAEPSKLGGFPRALTTDRLLHDLESGLISAGTSDDRFRRENSGLRHRRNGPYSMFSAPGLDVTDSIVLLSRDGILFYANYSSCSENRTFFRNLGKYSHYLLSAE